MALVEEMKAAKTEAWQEIKNCVEIDALLVTSGQPTSAQLTEIAAAGFEVVINVAMPSSSEALAKEGSLVTSTGMSYLHHPIVWESPTLADVLFFFDLMRACGERRVWVHCALNMRVSCLIAMYRRHMLGVSAEEVRATMEQVWTPNAVWAALMVEVEAYFAKVA